MGVVWHGSECDVLSVGWLLVLCSGRYNLACCLALSGADARSAELLSQLLACGGVTREDIAQDADLHEKPWVAQLLQATT